MHLIKHLKYKPSTTVKIKLQLSNWSFSLQVKMVLSISPVLNTNKLLKQPKSVNGPYTTLIPVSAIASPFNGDIKNILKH